MSLLRVVLGFVFGNPLGKLVAAAAGLSVLVLSFASHQQSIGARKTEARQERANAVARKKADDAARRSVDPAAAGLRNPHYRAD
jgi:hypothetical protein